MDIIEKCEKYVDAATMSIVNYSNYKIETTTKKQLLKEFLIKLDMLKKQIGTLRK